MKTLRKSFLKTLLVSLSLRILVSKSSNQQCGRQIASRSYLSETQFVVHVKHVSLKKLFIDK